MSCIRAVNSQRSPDEVALIASSAGKRSPPLRMAGTSTRCPMAELWPVFRNRVSRARCASRCSGGTTSSPTLWPSASEALQPKVSSAWRFHPVISPAPSMVMMAWCAPARMFCRRSSPARSEASSRRRSSISDCSAARASVRSASSRALVWKLSCLASCAPSIDAST